MSEIRQTLRLTDLNLDEANFILGQIQDRLDEMEGRRGTPVFRSSVDMGGNQLLNVAPSTNATDAIIQQEVKEIEDNLTAAIQRTWPIGAVFVSTVETNPAELIGFGTWEAFGAGKFLVGYDSSDGDFDSLLGTGGTKTKNLSHTHDMGNHTHSIAHTHADAGTLVIDGGATYERTYSGSSGTPSINTTGSGGSSAQDILPPYIVVYFWTRTA